MSNDDAVNSIPKDSLTYSYLNYPTTAQPYSSIVRALNKEKTSFGLFAKETLAASTPVAKFEGPIVSYDDCTDYDKRYVLVTQNAAKEWVFLLPMSNARYTNHACVPNCKINDNLDIVTTTTVPAGQELTFLYNKGTAEDEWDPIWSFNCQCGHEKGQGAIDAYRGA